MSNEKKTLSNQRLPEKKTTQKRAARKLKIALKIADILLKIISIFEKIIGWLG